ncbi:alg3, alpha-1,3- mannosyltransferase [Lycorma delicatula]|uniref:alg3, alpha-1,3- mannosyltransferase n=1 Tax=Lycorma delicatula TaxID=130591 RepID=UPI003F50FD40
MAPSKKSKESFYAKMLKKIKYLYWTYANKRFVLSLIFDPRKLHITVFFILAAELILNVVVINKVKYTEIDWVAYMQEVEGVVNGTYDYSKLKGDTGPLVYPAGFVYIFTLLYYLTELGKNIKVAQYVFGALYIIMLYFIFNIYSKSKKVPPYAIIIACCTSYRIHSIFILRMFNDPVAMILLYISVNLFISGYWKLASVFYSLAVSVKMNILLFSPAILLAYLCCLGFKGTMIQLSICAAVQLILGLPFLLTNPWAYLKGSFDLGRVFLYQWTVNWRFLPENVFLDRYFHISLLTLHIILLLTFLKTFKVCLQSYARLKKIETDVDRQLHKEEKFSMETSCQLFILPLFTCNLIGVACSRSLHYQFYVWYFHTLPYLLWCTPYSNVWRLIIMGAIEFCWNTYPSTVYSSAALHISHIAIIYGLYRNRPNEKNHYIKEVNNKNT